MANEQNSCTGTPATWALVPNSCTVILSSNGVNTPIDFSFLLAKVPSVVPSTMGYNENTHVLTHNGTQYPLNCSGLTFDPATCVGVFTDEKGSEYQFQVPKSSFVYDPASHSVIHNNAGESPRIQQLNCGKLGYDAVTCSITYVDEKGQFNAIPLPVDRHVYDPASCVMTIIPAKGGDPITFPVGVTEDQVQLSLNGKVLEFTYKNKKCQLTLPNSIVQCQYVAATNTLRFIHCDGLTEDKALAKASLNVATLPDGKQVVSFFDGCNPNPTQFCLTPTPIQLADTDTGSFDLSTGIFQIQFGGDGNSGSVVVNICDTVARLCNATFTAIRADGSFTFIDNAGRPFEYPAPPNCKTYHALSPDVLDETNPPAVPTNPPLSKQTGDTLVQHHPNGIAWFSCLNGAWSYNFMHTSSDNCCTTLVNVGTPIDEAVPPATPAAPPAQKTDGSAHIECHTNGLCAYSCVSGSWVLKWCKIIPTAARHYQTESTVLFDTAAPAQTPSNPPAVKNVGDTAITKHPNGLAFYSCLTTGWALNYFCPISEAVVAEDPAKETFKAGATLPANAVLPFNVCVSVDDVITVEAVTTAALPANLLGCVQVDETDGTTAYIPPHTLYFDCPVANADGEVAAPSIIQGASQLLLPKNVHSEADWGGLFDLEKCPVSSGRKVYKGPDGKLYTTPCVQRKISAINGIAGRVVSSWAGAGAGVNEYVVGAVLCTTFVNDSAHYQMAVDMDAELIIGATGTYGDGTSRFGQGRSEYSCDGGATWITWVTGQGFVMHHDTPYLPSQQQGHGDITSRNNLSACILECGESAELCIRTSLFIAGPLMPAATIHEAFAQTNLRIIGTPLEIC